MTHRQDGFEKSGLADETEALIKQPHISRAVEALATELAKRLRLSGAEAKALIERAQLEGRRKLSKWFWVKILFIVLGILAGGLVMLIAAVTRFSGKF